MIIDDLEQGFLPQLLAGHPGLSYSLEGEQSEQRETLGALIGNYAFAMVLGLVILTLWLGLGGAGR